VRPKDLGRIVRCSGCFSYLGFLHCVRYPLSGRNDNFGEGAPARKIVISTKP